MTLISSHCASINPRCSTLNSPLIKITRVSGWRLYVAIKHAPRPALHVGVDSSGFADGGLPRQSQLFCPRLLNFLQRKYSPWDGFSRITGPMSPVCLVCVTSHVPRSHPERLLVYLRAFSVWLRPLSSCSFWPRLFRTFSHLSFTNMKKKHLHRS